MPTLFTNKNQMNGSFLYTVPQWIIFAGIVAVIYGWVEQKRPFRIIGTSILIILGLYSLYIMLGGYLAAHKYFTPYEALMGELEEQEMLSDDDLLFSDVPFQIKLFPAYVSFLITATLAIPALIFELIKNKKLFRIFIIISILIALVGFFIIVDTIKTI
jgi:hypothetical protein